MNKTNDLELFKKLKSGSDKAFKEVYNDNRTLFLNFGRSYAIDESDLLDLYQDSYLVLYENIQSGKLKELTSSLSTYLLSIGKYKIMERLRKNRLQTNNEIILKSLKIEDEIKEFELDDKSLSNHQAQLKHCFEKLGLKCQTVLKQFYYRSMTIAEIRISENYNSDNVVKAQKSRCLKQLRDCVKTMPNG